MSCLENFTICKLKLLNNVHIYCFDKTNALPTTQDLTEGRSLHTMQITWSLHLNELFILLASDWARSMSRTYILVLPSQGKDFLNTNPCRFMIREVQKILFQSFSQNLVVRKGRHNGKLHLQIDLGHSSSRRLKLSVQNLVVPNVEEQEIFHNPLETRQWSSGVNPTGKTVDVCLADLFQLPGVYYRAKMLNGPLVGTFNSLVHQGVQLVIAEGGESGNLIIQSIRHRQTQMNWIGSLNHRLSILRVSKSRPQFKVKAKINKSP